MDTRSTTEPAGTAAWSTAPPWRPLAVVAGHLIGVVAVAALGAWAVVGTDHLRWIASIQRAGPAPEAVVGPLAVHLALSALVWSLGAGVVAGIRRRWTGPVNRWLAGNKATVMTETLIVVPVLLLVVMGIAQLAVNNIAGMLLNYGTSQAARSVWVTEPETRPLAGRAGRMGIDERDVRRRARIQVAAAMTPVAPSHYESDRRVDDEMFEKLRASFLGPQIAEVPRETGSAVLGEADRLDDFEASGRQSFIRALDGQSFPARTVRKFSSAYQAVDLEIDEPILGDDIGVEVSYHHLISFPLVGPVFGEYDEVGDTEAYYATFERDAHYHRQVPPNVQLPRR